MSSISHATTSPAGAESPARFREPAVGRPAAHHRLRDMSSGSAIGLAATLAGCALIAYVALSSPATGDYLLGAPAAPDNAAPAIAALSHGNVAHFLSVQPLMGLLSLLLRAPFAAVAAAFGADQLDVYRVGAFFCLLPTGLLAARVAVPWLRVGRRDFALGGTIGVVAAGVLLISPPIVSAVRSGHPEEVLATTLAAAAMLAAYGGRPVLTGMLLGAAIGTKEWAWIAMLPALVTLPSGRRRAAAIGGGVAIALIAPMRLLDTTAFARAGHALGGAHLVTALSAWWPLGWRPHSLHTAAPLVRMLPDHLTKSVVLPAGLAVATALALAAVVSRPGARLRARGSGVDGFALLCLLALVRCVADPGPVEYYYVALVIPLAVWESAMLRRPPLVTLLALAAIAFTYGQGATLDAGLLSAVTLAWAGALACYLIFRAFGVGPAPRENIDIRVG